MRSSVLAALVAGRAVRVGRPTAPVIAVTATTSDTITMSVTEPTSWGSGDPGSYYLQVSLDGGGTWPAGTLYEYPQTEIVRDNLSANTVYRYRLQADNTDGKTVWSNELHVRTPITPTTKALTTTKFAPTVVSTG